MRPRLPPYVSPCDSYAPLRALSPASPHAPLTCTCGPPPCPYVPLPAPAFPFAPICGLHAPSMCPTPMSVPPHPNLGRSRSLHYPLSERLPPTAVRSAAASWSKICDPLLQHEVEGVRRLGSLACHTGPSETPVAEHGRRRANVHPWRLLPLCVSSLSISASSQTIVKDARSSVSPTL